MKSVVFKKLAIFTLAFSGALSVGAMAQTTDEGTGPSEQRDAPMEVGDLHPNDAQPVDAQPGGPSGEAPAQTDQGVARISFMHGDVSTQRGDSGDWSAATLNQPVMTGDLVSTGDDARTELQLDFANTLRLGPHSKVNLANLTHKNIQIQLSEGTANVTVSKDSEAEPEIDTPNVSVHPAHHDGVFRVEIQPNGDTLVIVRKGEAQIATPQGSTEVRAGEMATVRGTSESAQYKISSAPDRDQWDRWNSDRDHLIQNATSYRHTNRYYTGAQDLDAYGHWRHVDDYGDVWYPDSAGDDWAPYRNGNWVYEPYYGWTWVGYEPWGWAPYHYGRWMYAGGGWGWWPGPIYGGYRPFWAPAYVSFWGWGGGFGFGFGYGGWGGFGWLPLGPCDWYHPWWGGYGGRFGVVNVTNIHITNINRFGGIHPLHGGTRFSNVANLHNQRIGRALSTVNAGHFGAGRINAMAASREQLGGARMMAGNLPVVPTHASLSASGRAAAGGTVRTGGPQSFYGSHNNVARPASFQQQTSNLRQAMQQNHVGAVPAGARSNVARSNNVDFAGNGRSFQRPSGGTPANPGNPANRGTTNFGNQASRPQNENRNGGFNAPGNNNRPTEPSRGTVSRPGESGFRPFTRPSGGTRSSDGNIGSSRPEPQRGTYQSPSSQAPTENRGGFRPFTPPTHTEAPRIGSTGNSPRGESGGYWNRTAPSSPSPRSYSDGYGRSSSRPQLDMRQPIVRGPSYGSSSGGYRGSPSYGGSRSAPSYGGSHSAPSYGGGGSHSAPSGGGGGHAPSGGGGHSSSGHSGGGHR